MAVTDFYMPSINKMGARCLEAAAESIHKMIYKKRLLFVDGF
jgi:alcohol dehydrogenase